jgi:hypothetical protein
MTRDEVLVQREQRLKQQLAAANRDLGKVQAKQREEARKQRDHRRFQVGKLAEDAGLFAWDDATLAGVFQLVAKNGAEMQAAVLESLLTAPGRLDSVSVNGTAQATPGVGPACRDE